MATGKASCVRERNAPAVRSDKLALKKQVLPVKCEITQWPRPVVWQDGEKAL